MCVFREDMVQTELIIPANHRLRPVDLGQFWLAELPRWRCVASQGNYYTYRYRAGTAGKTPAAGEIKNLTLPFYCPNKTVGRRTGGVPYTG